jgi:hypothetical protein
MARLRFIHGSITGKIGEFIGSKWKGINYLKTYTKPANPKTAKQTAVRLVFKTISYYADSLYKIGAYEYYPPRYQMTARNQVFVANKAMFTNKVFNRTTLALSLPNFQGFNGMMTNSRATWSSSSKEVGFNMQFYIDDEEDYKSYYAHIFLVNFIEHRIVSFSKVPIPSNLMLVGNVNNDNDTTPNNSAVYVFLTRTVDGKKYITRTMHFPLTAV